jgi:peroxiredoxin Q/BCP
MPENGDQAPDFELTDQNNRPHRLSAYRGQWVLLYFYPKALTPGCTTETCNFQEKFPEFTQVQAKIFGISRDSVKQQKKFADKYQVLFPLLSDETGVVCENYGVWRLKSLYGRQFMGIARMSFLINPQGRIEKIYSKVDVKTHAAEVLRDISEQIR